MTNMMLFTACKVASRGMRVRNGIRKVREWAESALYSRELQNLTHGKLSYMILQHLQV